MFWLSRIIFLIVPVLQKDQKIQLPKNHYKMIIKDNNPGCIEAKVTSNLARRFDAKPGNCNSVGCKEYKGKYKVPFCCTVKGYGCNSSEN